MTVNGLAELIAAYASLQLAAKAVADVDPGSQVDVDIPDIDVSYRVRGKQVKARILSVTVERVK
jgi:hypothetical protein